MPLQMCFQHIVRNISLNLKCLFYRVFLKAHSHDGISCTQLLSNSLIRKSSLAFQKNSTKNSMIQIAKCERALTV